MSPSPIASLPEELLLQIFSLLDCPPSSSLNSRQEPSLNLTTSSTTNFKALSLVSHLWRRIILPLLFQHSRLYLSPPRKGQTNPTAILDPYLTFVTQHDLASKIESLVVLVDRPKLSGQAHCRFPHQLASKSDDRYRASAEFWARVLRVLGEGLRRVVMVAPPAELACLTNCAIDLFGDWAFGDMDFHILELSMDNSVHPDSYSTLPTQDELSCVPTEYPGVAASSILKLRPWTHLALNEGSFLKAYGTYEYFERGPPSLIYSIKDCLASNRRNFLPNHQASMDLSSLKSFTYTAILPFANHLDFMGLLPYIEELDVQLAPDPESGILDDKDRVGKAELEDTWAEFIQGYRCITRPLRTFRIQPERVPKLKRFICRDIRNPNLRAELDEEFTPLCLPVWSEPSPGVFERLQAAPTYWIDS